MEDADKEVVNPQVANIRAEWDWVKPELESILAIDPNLTWRPEDVYASVLSGESFLWVHPNFFTVTTVESDMFNGDKTFMIWVMKAKEQGGANSVTYTKFYEDVAKQLGCQHIAGKSIQMPAIDYAVERVGWEITEITFGKDLRG